MQQQYDGQQKQKQQINIQQNKSNNQKQQQQLRPIAIQALKDDANPSNNSNNANDNYIINKQNTPTSSYQQNGIQNFFGKIQQTIAKNISTLVKDINTVNEQQNINQTGDLQHNSNNNSNSRNLIQEQRFDQQQINQQQKEKQLKLQEIRKKEQQLLQQLNNLRLQQQKLLNPDHQPQQQQEQTNHQQQEQQQYEYVLYELKPKAQSLSPIRSPQRHRYLKPKITLPEPIMPEMSRDEFELRVKEIAGHIRSKVHKHNPLKHKQQLNHLSRSLNRKAGSPCKVRQFEGVNLPQIQNRSSRATRSLFNNITFNQTQKPNQSAVQAPIEQQNTEGKSWKIARSILQYILKQTYEKIRYKQKFNLKLDPIHHKYPMTSFRRKVIQERYNYKRDKDKVLNGGLRASIMKGRSQDHVRSKK